MRKLVLLTMVTAVLLATALPAHAAPAAILTANFADGPRRVDPIVTPGGESAHEHNFYGVRGITPDTRTSASLRALPSTWVRASNHSAFWVPPLYEDGRALTPATSKHILAYYQFTSNTRLAPPEDTAGVSHEMGYRCGTGGGAITDLPPSSCPAGTPIVMSGFMRGVRDLGLGGSQVFDIRVFIRLSRGTRGGALGQMTLGGPPGSGHTHPLDDAHFDYIWAHDRAKFQAFIDQCAPPASACGTNPAVLA